MYLAGLQFLPILSLEKIKKISKKWLFCLFLFVCNQKMWTESVTEEYDWHKYAE